MNKRLTVFNLTFLRSFIFLCLAVSLSACSGGGSAGGASSLVAITVEDNVSIAKVNSSAAVQVKTERNTLYAQAIKWLKDFMEPTLAFAGIPSNVKTITFTIKGLGMTTIVKDVVMAGQSSITETFEVKNGYDRSFLIEEKDSSGDILYWTTLTLTIDANVVSKTGSLLPRASRGNLDASFGTGGKVINDITSYSYDRAQALALQSDGKIVIVGSTLTDASRYNDFFINRYNTDGSLDLSFGTTGKVTTDINTTSDHANSVVIQPNGKIVVVGDAYAELVNENETPPLRI